MVDRSVRLSASNFLSFSQSASPCSRGIQRSRSPFSSMALDSAARTAGDVINASTIAQPNRRAPRDEEILDSSAARLVAVGIEFGGIGEFLEEVERAHIAILIQMLGNR